MVQKVISRCRNQWGTSFNECELENDEYLKNLGTHENIEQTNRPDRLENNDHSWVSYTEKLKQIRCKNWKGR